LINYDNIVVDFVNIKDENQPKVFNTYFKPYFEDEKLEDISNISVSKTSTINLDTYDFAISLSRNWVLSSYLHKPYLLDFISKGLPVITNIEDPLYQEIDFIRKVIYPIDINLAKSQIENLYDRKTEYTVTEETMQHVESVFSLLTLIYIWQ
jgi:hypothetical protein